MTDVYGDTEVSETESPRSLVDQGRLGGVFCQLYKRKFSGLVEIASEGRSAMVTFRAGRPISLDDASGGVPLGEQLVDAGRLTRAQYSAVIARVTDGLVENEDLAFCQHAVELGFLDREQAGTELSQRVRMRLLQLFAWQACEVVLEELDDVAAGPDEYSQELGAIVYMGVRTFYDDAVLRGYLPEPSSHYLQLRSQPALIAEFFSLEHDELKLLRAVDPRSTFDTLIDASILDPAHATALLALLQIAQLCEFSRAPFMIEAERERSGARPFPVTPAGALTQDPRRASQNAMRAIGAGRPLSQQVLPAVSPARAPSQQGMPIANPRRAPSQHGMPAMNPGRAPSQQGIPAVNAGRSPSQRNFPALDPSGPSSGSSIPPALRASRTVSESPPPTEEVNHSASQYKMTAVHPGRPPTNPRLGAVHARPPSQQGVPAADPEPESIAQPEPAPAARAPLQPVAAPTQQLTLDATQEALREAAARAAQSRRNPPRRMNRAPFQEPARPAPASPRERATTDVSRPLPTEPAAIAQQDRGRAPEPQRTAAEAPLDPAARAEYAKAHLNEIMRRRQAKPQPNEANAAAPRRDPMRELRQAQELLRDQHYARAEDVLRNLAESDPSNELFRAYLLWARLRNVAELESGQMSELTDLAKKLIQIPEHLAFACYVLGHIYLAAKKDELAEKYFRRAHAADRGNKDAERHLLILERRKQQAAEADAGANRKIFGITIATKPKT